MDFRILGPIEVFDGERPLALGGARQRALLGMLLLHAGEVVSSDRLIEELWPGERGEDASGALQVAVSRLRKSLQPARAAGTASRLLVTRPPGYGLLCAPESIDAKRFEALAERARRALARGAAREARELLGEALGLWRGAPLADLAYESFCQAEIGRLEELRLAALEDWLAAGLELGEHAELVGRLRALVREQPLRERAWAQLMLALYRSGRQAEALDAYAEARATLVEQLGIEPGRELRGLQQAILEQDPALELTPRADARDASSRGIFVGREREFPSSGRRSGTRWPARDVWCCWRASRESARAGSVTSWSRGRGRAERTCWSAVAGRRAAPRPTGRGSRPSAPTSVRSSRRRCERSSAPARPISPSCFPSCALSFPSFLSRRRSSRRARAFDSSTPRARFFATLR